MPTANKTKVNVQKMVQKAEYGISLGNKALSLLARATPAKDPTENKARKITTNILAKWLPIVSSWNTTVIDRAITKYAKQVPKETSVTAEYPSMKAVLDKTKISSSAGDTPTILAKRNKILQRINSVISGARSRQKKFSQLIEPFSNTPEYPAILEFKDGMVAHISSDWLAESNLEQRIKSICRLSEEKYAAKQVALEICSETNEEQRNKEHHAMLALTQNRSDAEPQRATEDVVQNALQRAYAIKDADGSIADIDRSIAHLPPTVLPLSFVEDLLRWRKQARPESKLLSNRLAIDQDRIRCVDKILLSNIEWPLVNTVENVLQMASEGHVMANVQLIKNSERYAKAYLAALVKKNDPLAHKLIIDQGIRDSDLQNQAIALAILRPTLATNKGEEPLANFADIENPIPRTAKETNPNQLVIALNNPYVNTPVPNTEFDSEEGWASDFDSAQSWCKINSGLRNASERITRTLENITPVMLLLQKKTDRYYLGVKSGKSAQDIQLIEDAKQITQYTKQLQSLIDISKNELLAYTPFAYSGEIHEPMLMAASHLHEQLVKKQNALQSTIESIAQTSREWELQREPSISPTDWRENWQSAVLIYSLPKGDNGFATLLEKIEQKEMSGLRRSPDLRRQRIACLDLIETYHEAVSTIKTLEKFADESILLDKYIIDLIALLEANTDELRQQIDGEEWQTNPLKSIEDLNPHNEFAFRNWEHFMAAADQEGFIESTQEGVKVGKLLSITHFQLKDLAGEVDLQRKLALRSSIKAHLISVVKELKAIEKNNETSHNDFLSVLRQTSQLMIRISAELSTALTKITFAIRDGLNAEAWEETYTNAIFAGAIPLNANYQQLHSALTEFENKERIFAKHTETPRKKFQAVKELVDAIEKIKKEVRETLQISGFSNNKKMVEYLNNMHTECESKLKGEELRRVLFGTDKNFPSRSFEWPHDKMQYKRLHRLWLEIENQAERMGIYARVTGRELEMSLLAAGDKIYDYQRSLKNTKFLYEQSEAAKQKLQRLIPKMKQYKQEIQEKETEFLSCLNDLQELEGRLQTVKSEVATNTQMERQKAEKMSSLQKDKEQSLDYFNALTAEKAEIDEQHKSYQREFIVAQDQLNEYNEAAEETQRHKLIYIQCLDNIIEETKYMYRLTHSKNFRQIFAQMNNGAKIQKQDLLTKEHT